VVSKQFLGIYSVDSIDRDVGGLMLKSTMDVNVRIHYPTGVAEALDGLEFVPLGRLCIIDFESNVFAYLISASSDYHHEGANKKGRVLITRGRCLSVGLVGCFNPVPTAITMSTKTPSITERSLI
jgi:hypothetical protein